MSRLGRAALVGCVVAVALAAVPGALGAGEYGLDSPSAVDVPDRTMAIGYEGFAVDSIARVSKGEDLAVRATAPPDARYRVELFSSLRMGVAISDREMRGNDSASFETGHLEPGSYLAALFEGDEIRAVLPVVVEGYAVSVDVPGTVEAGAEATVAATLSKDPASPDAARVELVVVDASGETVVRREMTQGASGYSATIRPDDPGEYDVYVNVRGQNSVRDERVLLGFSDPRTLSVTATSSPADGGTEAAATDARDGEATPSGTAPATTAPEGVITRNATVGSSTLGESPPTAGLSTALTLFLAAGLGLLLWTRR